LENLLGLGFCWLASKFKLATLSNEISWLQLTGACLAGVGFTMSIFCRCSFDGEVLSGAKLSILIASVIRCNWAIDIETAVNV
jgi:NhaA family Na+:H+ antiporter